MAKYKDFDDDYIYDDIDSTPSDEQYEYADDNYSAYDYDADEYGMEEGEYQSPRKRHKKKKKRFPTWAKACLIVVGVLILIVDGVLLYGMSKLNKITYVPLDEDKIVVNEGMSEQTQEVLKGYTNILLLGSDARDNSADALKKVGENHTDAIIVASINNQTKEVKLISVYRDTLLKMDNSSNTKFSEYNKATEAMFNFGIEATINMINTNMDLDIKDFVMVNWEALIDIIDAVGGIDIEITEVQRYWTNLYLVDTGKNTGRDYTEIPEAGYVHLDGIQATAFCRVRYDGGSDYGRTEKQREVISLVVEKAKNMKNLNAVIESVVGNIATSLETSEILDYAADVTKYTITDSVGFPFEKTDQITTLSNSKITDPVIPVNLSQNITELHELLFGVSGYKPTQTVQDISNHIIEWTGAQ